MTESQHENPLHLTCKACGHQWTHILLLPQPMAAVMRALLHVHCPSCSAGSSKIGIGSPA